MSRPICCCPRCRGQHPELGAGRECRALRTDPLGLRRSRRDTGFGRGQRRDHYEGHGRRRLARRRVPAARLRRPGSRTRTERRPGRLTFPDLAPGVYRLKQTASGSPLHEVVSDQDVIVTPGATTRLTITDPFKAAKVLLQAKDDKTGRLLPGATVNIGTGTSTLLTLTTGTKGAASGELPVSSRRTQFWVKEIKAPAGYDLHKPTKTFTAGPGAPVTVTVTNAKTATDPKPDPSSKPTHRPTDSPSSPGKPNSGTAGATPSASGSDTPEPDSSPVAATSVKDSTQKTSTGSLAHTGADATPWLIGGAAVLIAAGGGALLLARRSRTDSPTDDSPES